MPKRTTDKGFPVNPEDCYASRHMGAEYRMYDVMLGFAYAGRVSREGRDGKGPLLFNASIKPRMCNELNLSKNQAYDLKDKLLSLGWIILRAKGTKKPDGTSTPDTFEVVLHAGYVKTRPGSCPDYQYAPDFDAATAAGVRYGQRLRQTEAVPENFFRWPDTDLGIQAHVLHDFLERLTVEEREKVIEHWKTADPRPVDLVLEVPNPVPVNRERASPSKPGPDQSRKTDYASPGKLTAPVPENRTTQSQVSGTNLVTAPGTVSGTTTTTTTTTPRRPWLSWLWSKADDSLRISQHEKYKSLKFRPAKPATIAAKHSGAVSPDDAAIEELITKHGETAVKSAWACFAENPAPHCSPPESDHPTLYPITVFLKHFDSYMADGRAAYKAYADNGKDAYARGVPYAIAMLAMFNNEQRHREKVLNR